MSFHKQNFLLFQCVIFHSTMSDLDGQLGTILGTYADTDRPWPDCYIVELHIPRDNQLAVVMTEACLKALGNE